MRRALRLHARVAIYWMALVCLLGSWGISGALELDEHRLESLAASQYGAKGSARVTAWLHLLQADRDLAEPAKLASINDFWNQSVAQSEDRIVWGTEDYWATPLEALGKGAGDCEDYVIGKYFSLIKLGVPTSKLRFVYVKARVGGPQSTEQVAHMVLGYYPTPDAMPLVLDSLVSNILPASQRRDLVPIFSFNAEGVYVDGKQAAPVDRIGRWRNLLQRMEREGIRQ
jgi:predicted transglutaminase-like cysteine proteinase